MKWFVTGDIHGDLFRIYNWIKRLDMNYENVNVIIVGDAGICWRRDKRDMKQVINFHEEYYNFHLWFIDGNHENFDVLNEFPTNDIGIADLSLHIHYIPRGTVLTLETESGPRTVLFCGGADSVDKFRRTPHLTWWADEMITQKDIDKCLSHGVNKFDYVITHCCPYSIFKQYAVYLITLTGIDQEAVEHESELMLEQLMDNIECRNWFFGHYHVDKQLDDIYQCLFDNFIEL